MSGESGLPRVSDGVASLGLELRSLDSGTKVSLLPSAGQVRPPHTHTNFPGIVPLSTSVFSSAIWIHWSTPLFWLLPSVPEPNRSPHWLSHVSRMPRNPVWCRLCIYMVCWVLLPWLPCLVDLFVVITRLQMPDAQNKSLKLFILLLQWVVWNICLASLSTTSELNQNKGLFL